MKLLYTLMLLFIASSFGLAQEMETLCDDFTSDLWEALEGDTIGYSTSGTEPILGPAWFNPGGGYTIGSITFNFNGANQTAEFDLLDSWGWEGEYHDITINESTMINLGESFPMIIDGFTLDLTRDTLASGAIEIALSIQGELNSVKLEGAETQVQKLCVNRPSTASFNEHEIASPQLYPNPVSHEIQLSTTEQISSYSIYTVSGKLITSETFVAIGQKRIDVSAFETGVYLITVKTENGATNALRFTKN